MDETVTLQTLLIAVAPFAVLLLITLFATVLGGGFEAAGRRLRGHPSRMVELERRVATLETALKRARASELPLEIEAERLAEEIHQMGSRQRDPRAGARTPAPSVKQKPGAALTAPSAATGGGAKAVVSGADEVNQANQAASADSTTPSAAENGAPAAATAETAALESLDLTLEFPPDPNESEDDRLAREQLETEERERIVALAAEEARIRHEREEAEERTRARVEAEATRRRAEQEERDRAERERREEAERIERERLEVEATRRRDEEQRRKAEEFRRRVADATPKIVMSAGGSNREAVTINIAVTNNLTPKHAELALLSPTWERVASPAAFTSQRKDGLYEERWPKQIRSGPAPAWGSYEDTSGRVFECPEDAPTDTHVWIVISYDRTAGGAASTWQRFEVGGAGALWYVRQPIGDPVIVEAERSESEAAA
ncbi:MAG: hypothetical protein O3A10_11190 [Chloroflexi bacterium]|nr:hypothetical protein [Chloroflexota bacterium]